mmetsp:Transcript_24787/g.59793  ORF Transcript_24787/g.59793 Transcript_24787/m.59793 type:complete len:175 (+) Transcript_24787:63-587(+)|eukprot:CAMPEP_0181105678 /NCGR_PEP_ID=MMETSP1071-20121207/16119_1 /TAXON_ID=35127 /ORGANISM="Thalassiosira sp., Strain NH16" /LENGTH=174 /DNA_ID=CAMNT_0023189019 /DNA_START=1 /DNA_END=525 /DNA_ORIENTATION=-
MTLAASSIAILLLMVVISTKALSIGKSHHSPSQNVNFKSDEVPSHGNQVSLNASTQSIIDPSSLPYMATFLDRRSAAVSIIGLAFATPASVLADEPAASDADAPEEAKERMRKRIAESKKNYRKPTDLVKERKDTTDYSCVSDTGSPCPEGLVPKAVQREIVGVLDKLEKSQKE